MVSDQNNIRFQLSNLLLANEIELGFSDHLKPVNKHICTQMTILTNISPYYSFLNHCIHCLGIGL